MPHFSEFTNIPARFDALMHDSHHKGMRIPLPKKHSISMSINRVGLFKTGGINVNLVSISKSGALFNTQHHALQKPIGTDLTVSLALNGKHFEYEAHLVRQDTTNKFYGLKFEQSIESVDDYLIEHHIHPYYSDSVPHIGSVWLHLAES